MSRKIILIKQELLLLVYELNRSGLLAENEKIRPILAQLEKLLLCDLSPSTNDSVNNFFFFNDTATTEIYTLSLHDALPIFSRNCAICCDPRNFTNLRNASRL